MSQHTQDLTDVIPNLSLAEVAQLCGVGAETVRLWVVSGKLKARKVGGRWRSTQQWISEMINPAAVRTDYEADQAQAAKLLMPASKKRGAK